MVDLDYAVIRLSISNTRISAINRCYICHLVSLKPSEVGWSTCLAFWISFHFATYVHVIASEFS